MAQLMTVLISYEDALVGRNGVSLETKMTLPRANTSLESLYLQSGEKFTWSELLKALVMTNELPLAEAVARHCGKDNPATMVKRMNGLAVEIGMKNTKFFTVYGNSGMGRGGNCDTASAADLVKLAERVLRHERLMEWYSTVNMDLGNRQVRQDFPVVNRNQLVAGPVACPGATGLIVGYGNNEGHCMTATCRRNGRQLIVVVAGLGTSAEMYRLAAKLFDWGLAQK